MKELGYRKDYKYAHDSKDAFVPQDYLPEELRDEVHYEPANRGYEKIIKEELMRWQKIRASIL
jgi:putative ATPase